ncbi:MAG: hypothetical protein AB1499_08500 [Nitrospirota bacterium]
MNVNLALSGMDDHSRDKILRSVCPDCLQNALNTFGQPSRTSYHDVRRREEERKKQLVKERLTSLQHNTARLNLLIFGIAVICSILVLSYSLIFKFLPKSNLPDFPFISYIIGYVSFWIIFIVVSIVIWSRTLTMRAVPSLRLIKLYFVQLFGEYRQRTLLSLMIILVTFGSPTFRKIFSSHFSDSLLMFLYAVMFVVSSIVLIQIINNSLAQIISRGKFRNKISGLLLFLLLSPAIYFGLISPFYLGVIKMNAERNVNIISPEAVDKIYEEELTAEKADREIARRYFNDGKKSANKGTRAGFNESIELYQRALELIPGFSAAYAETAYSYASLAGISAQQRGGRTGDIEGYYAKANKALDQAEKNNSGNPSVVAVRLIVQYLMSEIYLSDKVGLKLTNDQISEMNAKIAWAKGEGLKKLNAAAKKSGFTDKVFLAKAVLSESSLDRGSFLMTIIKIDPSNAEAHNLLGMVYFLVNNEEAAKKMFQKAVLLSPDYGEASLNLALVSDDKDGIYRKVARTDADFKATAELYARLLSLQKYLSILYVALVVWFFFRMIQLAKKSIDPVTRNIIIPDYRRRIRRQFLMCVLIFIVTFGAFEWYIHIYHPVETISHMFPVRFPFI